MALKFIRKKIKLHFGGTPEERYIVSLWNSNSVSQEYIIDVIKEKSSATRGDIEMVLEQLKVQLGQLLQNGYSVKLNRLGTFRPSLKVRSSRKLEDVAADKIIKPVIRFTPSKEIKQILKDTPVIYADSIENKHL